MKKSSVFVKHNKNKVNFLELFRKYLGMPKSDLINGVVLILNIE